MMPRKTRQQLAAAKKIRNAKYRAAFVARGLRCDGRPRAPRKPCGCRNGRCLRCMGPGDKGYFTPVEITAMYADYTGGMSLTAVGEKYGVDRKSVGGNFTRRGLALRPQKKPALGFGVRIPEPTENQIQTLIAGLTRLCVPPALKQVWKRWPLAKRRDFIKKLRVKFPSTRPTGPFSAGVTPFEYGTPAAHAIVARRNLGRTSQTKVAALKPGSEGVMHGGLLYFWIHSHNRGEGYQCGGKPQERFFLHRVLWEKFNGRPVPPQMTVIHADGNKNNFSRNNLTLRSMADCARMNAWHRRPEKYPGLAKRIAHKSWLGRGKKMNAVSRAQIGALLDDSANGIFEQITRSKS